MDLEKLAKLFRGYFLARPVDFIRSVYYAALLLRRGRILRRTLSVRLSVRLSVCPSVPLSSVTSRHLANYNDTLRAAYRTAISAAQTCLFFVPAEKSG